MIDVVDAIGERKRKPTGPVTLSMMLAQIARFRDEFCEWLQVWHLSVNVNDCSSVVLPGVLQVLVAQSNLWDDRLRASQRSTFRYSSRRSDGQIVQQR